MSGPNRAVLPVIAALLASVAGAAALAPTPAKANAVIAAESSLKVLSAQDAQRYEAAFAAMRRGDFIAGQNLERQISDPCLMGRLEAVRLLHPAYRANYAELKAWLERYRDAPEAQRVYDLALKHRPRSAALPPAPLVGSGDAAAWAAAQDVAEKIASEPRPSQGATPGQRAAREAFYKGNVEQALTLAFSSGERWIGGLAAYRLKRYDASFRNFSELAADARQNGWVRSAAAFWASRAAAAGTAPARSTEFLKLAARFPDTFYGLIASRELAEQQAKAPKGDPIGDLAQAAAVEDSAVAQLVRTDPRARRAAALAQIGLPLEAGQELRSAIASASPSDRPKLTSLALSLNAPLNPNQDLAKSGWARFQTGSYPTPVLKPKGGFTIDKALVYALVRQESKFNPNAISAAGAYGLMQLTAETAARLAGDDSLRRHPSELRDPALNLRLGQDYVARLLSAVKGDVLRAVAAYNQGPGAIQKMTARLGDDTDSLLLIESMPGGETRAFVQRVMANYWIYREIFGMDSGTLKAAASGAKVVAQLDR